MTEGERTLADEGVYETPPAVIGSIAAGVGPLPFLGFYAVLFLLHGLVYPVSPPDITSSRSGEAIAGVVALVLFFFVIYTIWWFLNRRYRWPFVLGQLATLATAIDFIIDKTTGSALVPSALVLTSATALVLAFTPEAARHMRRRPRRTRPSQNAAQTPESVPD